MNKLNAGERLVDGRIQKTYINDGSEIAVPGEDETPFDKDAARREFLRIVKGTGPAHVVNKGGKIIDVEDLPEDE